MIPTGAASLSPNMVPSASSAKGEPFSPANIQQYTNALNIQNLTERLRFTEMQLQTAVTANSLLHEGIRMATNDVRFAENSLRTLQGPTGFNDQDLFGGGDGGGGGPETSGPPTKRFWRSWKFWMIFIFVMLLVMAVIGLSVALAIYIDRYNKKKKENEAITSTL